MISLRLEAWHNRLLEAVLFITLSALIFYLLTLIRYKGGKRKRRQFRWLFSVGNSLLLTLFTIGCSGNYPFLLEEQVTLFSELHRFKSLVHWNQSSDVLLGNHRLLLVDVSHDMALIPDPAMNETWKSNQLITDRKKLAQFLKLLNALPDSLMVDLVVCDLLFPEFSPDSSSDNDLQTALDSLNKKGKLLMAQSGLDENKTLHDTTAINPYSMLGGSVDITKYYDETYFSYVPVRIDKDTSKSQPSLPYVLYKILKSYPSIPTRKDLISNSPPAFIPDFWIDNEDAGRGPDESLWKKFTNYLKSICPESEPKLAEPELQSFSNELRSSLFYLGQVADTDTSEFGGRTLFKEQLSHNEKKNKKTIVFIGIFEDPDRDIHQTLVGPMHGSILLINLLLNLLAGSHQTSFGYVVYLALGFLFTSFLLFSYNLTRKPIKKKPKKKKKQAKFDTFLRDKANQFIYKIIENRAYIVAFFILIGAITFFNHQINLVVIGIYLGICNEILLYLLPSKDT